VAGKPCRGRPHAWSRKERPNPGLGADPPIEAVRSKGTEAFARSADWRIEADRILAGIKAQQRDN